MDFKQEIIRQLKRETRLKEIYLEVPPSPEFGDYAFPCFGLAKELKKNPNEIAQGLVRKIKLNGVIKRVEAKGPYLNFFVDKDKLIEAILKEIIKNRERYGSKNINKRALIEHTSINPNASPHVGRARNAIIGDAVTRLLKFQGYKTEVHYYVNDVGKQIAMLVYAAKNKKISFNGLLKKYVAINKKVEESKKIEKEVLNLLYELERGDKKIKKQFRDIVETCVRGQIKILSDLEINYDCYDYESKYLWNKDTKKIIERLKKTNKLFKDENNRYVLNQEEYKLAMKAPFLVLTRSDGTSLYPLRDIAYNIEKLGRAKDENIVVLGEDQKLYFQQVAAALDLLKYKAPLAVFYSFILLKTGKMSTRKGDVVLLEDFMREAVKKAKEEIKKRKKAKVTEELAKTIGYGALKYSILKISPEKNVVFDWQQALNFEGETGPYMQYAHARVCSILKKYKKKVSTNIDFSLFKESEEINLVKKLGEFPDTVDNALKNIRPSIIATYCYELAKVFNDFYEKHSVLKAEDSLRNARLLLIGCVKQVLKNSLNLLGIKAPERM